LNENFLTVQVDWIVVSHFPVSLVRNIWSTTVGIKQLISLTVVRSEVTSACRPGSNYVPWILGGEQ